MTAPASQMQWYLAREGQQYGPLSDAELAKFMELGHLQSNDLLWREGFTDWRPALVVFPQRQQRQTAPTARRPPPSFGNELASPRLSAEGPLARTRLPHSAPAEAEEGAPRRSIGGVLRKMVVALILIGALYARMAGYPHRAQIGTCHLAADHGSGQPGRSQSLERLLAGLRGRQGHRCDHAVGNRVARQTRVPDWYAARLRRSRRCPRPAG